MHRLLYHLLFWIGYILFKVVLNLTAEPLEEDWAMETLWSDSIAYLTIQLFFLLSNVPAVYGIFYCIEKYFNDQWSLMLVLIMSLVLFGLAVVSINIINYQWVLPYLYPDRSFKLVFEAGSHLYHAFNLGALVGIACAIKLVRKQLRSKVNEQILTKEKAVTELKFLKAQINPHFLFNTLNNIYSLARKESKETPEVILKLSKLMRFMLYEASSPTILLSDEMKLIEDYITLEKLRYSDRLRVDFRTDLDFPSQRIAPLLLIHFVENAFKHGASESRFDSLISIHIQLKKGTLLATVTNTTEENQQPKEDNAIGLNNIKRQLELLYPKHTLTIKKEEKRFSIELIIPLP
jgi:two-component system, LytTR family, sensor kinase